MHVMEDRLSIIVPVYNVEQYIADCLDSIIGQTYDSKKMEVIIVDDGSEDRSIDIARGYAKKHPYIRIVHQENGGTGKARNLGLKHATGTYVTFVDADDFVSLNTYEYIMGRIKEEQYSVDLAIYQYEYYSASGRSYPLNPSASLFQGDRIITEINKFPEIIFATSVCNKVFKRSLLEDVEFPQSHMEDVKVSTLTTFKSSKIFLTDRCTYYYRKREDALHQSKTDNYYNNQCYYWDHLQANRFVDELKNQYPQYSDMIDWFNARSLHPFVYHMVMNKRFRIKEKVQFYRESRKLLSGVESITIQRLEKPLSRYITKSVQNKGFVLFFSSLVIYQLKNKIISAGSKIYKLLDLLAAFIASFFFKLHPDYKSVWLICERGYEAQDNGYRFFEYMRKHKKNEHPNVFYLIDFNNKADYYKVRELGNVIPYRSFKHKLLFMLAEKLISAHRGTIEPWNYEKFSKTIGKLTTPKKYIFLQHGITKDNVCDVLGRNSTSFNLFITGSKPEYDYISGHFGYKEDEVVYTGFARFDALWERQEKQQILIMPTWRKKITWLPEAHKKESIFLQSEYYKRYQSLINNPELIKLLEDNRYCAVFYPHFEVQPFLKHFNSTSSNIIVASKDEYDVQQLLKESKLLITDYSSVFFDFAYMDKPVIYYQFDREDFVRSHYKKGYFDYHTDGFGPVVENERALLDALKISFAVQHSVPHEYGERIRKTFILRDRYNCQRIYDAIIRLN